MYIIYIYIFMRIVIKAIRNALKREFGNYEKFKELIPAPDSFSTLENWVLHHDSNTNLYRLYSSCKTKLILRDTFILEKNDEVEFQNDKMNVTTRARELKIELPKNAKTHKPGTVMRLLRLDVDIRQMTTIRELIHTRIEKMVMDNLYADEECFDAQVEISPDFKWAYGILLDRPTSWDSWSRSGSYNEKSHPVDFDPIYLFRLYTENFDWMPILVQEHYKGVDVDLKWTRSNHLVATREFSSYYDTNKKRKDIVITWSPGEDEEIIHLLGIHFSIDIVEVIMNCIGEFESIDPRSM
jgi:hypothetical protein